MRKLFSLLGLMLLVNVGWGQIIAWQLNGASGSEPTINASVNNSNLNTSTLSRSGGILASAASNSFSSNNYTASGTRSDAVTNGRGEVFTISAKPGYQVSLSTLDAKFRRSSTGPNTFVWQYSLDGSNFTSIGADISYTLSTSNGDAQAQVSLSSISALQNVPSGTTITFRRIGWGASQTTGTSAIGKSTTTTSTDYSLAVGGTVLALEPTLAATAASITRVDPNSVNISWTNGNGANRIVVIKENGAVTYTPTDGTAPSGVNSDFSLATDQGSGNKIVYNGTGSSVSVTGLTTSTPLNIAIYEYNGTGTSVNYLTTAALTLPVSFSSINAINIGKNNKVTWSTASEEHNRGFDVQRSTDGVNYTSLGFVNSLSSTGNSSSTLNYSFIDYDPIGLKQYYRLKQTDFDGTSRYSGVVVVTNAVPERLAVTSIYPNPTSSFVHLSVASPSREAMQLIVIDANGRTVRSKYVSAEIGNNSFEIDATGLGAGVYYLSLKGPLTGWQSIGKFVKN